MILCDQDRHLFFPHLDFQEHPAKCFLHLRTVVYPCLHGVQKFQALLKLLQDPCEADLPALLPTALFHTPAQAESMPFESGWSNQPCSKEDEQSLIAQPELAEWIDGS